MDTLICKVCGYTARASEEGSCPECGAPLYPVEQAPAAGEDQGPEEEVYINQEKPVRKKATAARRAAWLLLVCLAVQALGLWALKWQSTPEDWSEVWGSDLVTSRGVYRMEGGFLSSWGGDGRPHRLLWSTDYLIYDSGVLTDGPTWYYYDGRTLERVDWQGGTISGDGKVLFYLRTQGEETVLYRKELRRGAAQEVDRVRGDQVAGIDSAWDGSAAVYMVTDGADARGTGNTLRQWDRVDKGHDLELGADENYLRMGRDGQTRVTARVLNEGAWSYRLRWGERDVELGGEDVQHPPIVDRDIGEILYCDGQEGYRYETLDGRQETVTGLPQGIWLTPLMCERERGGYGLVLTTAHLTRWVYKGNDNHLYYLDDHLAATDLTPQCGVNDYLIDEACSVLYYSNTLGEIYRVDRPGTAGEPVLVGERSGWKFSATPDLSLIGYRTWEDGVEVQEVLDTRSGQKVTLKASGDSCLLPGGRWRADGQGQLWFWGRGESEESQVLLEEAEEEKAKKTVDLSHTLQRVGDGSQAILCVERDRALDTDDQTLTGYIQTWDYWLLDDKGTAKKLDDLPVPSGK